MKKKPSTVETEKQFRQGDVFIYAAAIIPDNAKPAKRDPRGAVLAEGEATGHHHRIGPMHRSASLLRSEDGRTFLRATGTSTPRVRDLVEKINLSTAWADPMKAPPLEGIALAAARAEALDLDAVPLNHEEHGEILIPPGDYEVYIQREYQPDGVRQVED